MSPRLIAWLIATVVVALAVTTAVYVATAAELSLTFGGSLAGGDRVSSIAAVRGAAAGLSVAAIVGALGFVWDAARDTPEPDGGDDRTHSSGDYRW